MAARGTDQQIDVVGLRELRKSLKALSGDAAWHKQLRGAGLKAAEIVAVDARSRAPQRTGKLKRSIKARATQTGASVAMGGARVPYAPWVDYGGTIRPRGHPIRRTFIKTGRILYPALKAKRAEAIDAYERATHDVIEASGLDVT